MRVANREVTLKMIATTITSLIVVIGLGWTGNEMFTSKPSHQQVAQSLGEREYIRYEERIEEIDEEVIETRYDGDISDAEKNERIDKLNVRRGKYEKRQTEVVK